MSPEEVITEVEALDKAATPGPWSLGHSTQTRAEIKAPLDTVEAGEVPICVGLNGKYAEDCELIARYRTLAPELARMLREALARSAFLYDETGKVLEIIVRRIELNPPIADDEQSDLEAVARWVKGVGAEHLAQLMQERDEAAKRAAEWEIQAQDFRDRVVKAEAEREELRASYGKLKALHAELAADVSLLRLPHRHASARGSA